MRSVIKLKNNRYISSQETAESLRTRKVIAERDSMTHILVHVRKGNGQRGIRPVLISGIRSIDSI